MGRYARTGRNLGSDDFLAIAERLAGRSLRRKKTLTEAEQGKACWDELRTLSPELPLANALPWASPTADGSLASNSLGD